MCRCGKGETEIRKATNKLREGTYIQDVTREYTCKRIEKGEDKHA